MKPQCTFKDGIFVFHEITTGEHFVGFPTKISVEKKARALKNQGYAAILSEVLVVV